MLITNATLFTPATRIDEGAVRIVGDKIEAVGQAAELASEQDGDVLNANDLLLVPGFIDLQLNGAFGYDFTYDPSTIWQVAAQLPRYGVTSFLPTIITSPLPTISAAQEALADPPANFAGARPLGLHLEGPFLNPAKKGAHNPAHLRQPDRALAAEWSPQSGVRLVTLAPELPMALDVVQQLAGNGVVVSAGHSMATYEEALAAIDAGLRYGTHIFNAMRPIHQRQPGLVAALLSADRVSAGMIADGVHVHPALVSLLWQLLGPNRLNLVTDAITALGMSPGTYQLADQTVVVDEERATLPDGTLAGSILSLDAALRNLIQFTNCSLAEALQTITTTPAELLKLAQIKGRIEPGCAADLVLLSPNLKVQATIVAGKVVYQSHDAKTNHGYTPLPGNPRTA